MFTGFVRIIFILSCVLHITREVDGSRGSQVEVRAVFINCAPDDRSHIALDNEATRFEREELYKHSALQDCHKKIALTVKIVNNPNENTNDEYIPIEHVFQGPKRVRILNPYVLRLRRGQLFQAYKLRKIDVVNGVLEIKQKESRRVRRSTTVIPSGMTVVKNRLDSRSIAYIYDNTTRDRQISKHCDFSFKAPSTEKYLSKRDLRQAENDMMDDIPVNKKSPDTSERNRKSYFKTSGINKRHENGNFQRSRSTKKQPLYAFSNFNEQNDQVVRSGDLWSTTPTIEPFSRFGMTESEFPIMYDNNKNSYNNDTNKAEYFSMYDIEKPDIWYDISVQLFEKLGTPEGKTVWHDITRGQVPRVNSRSPEWKSPDMSVRFSSTEWMSRENFILPTTQMYLLVKEANKNDNVYNIDNGDNTFNNGKYIIVPKEDITKIETENADLKKRGENTTQFSTEKSDLYPRVLIRTSRALNEKKMNIKRSGKDEFLTIPHTRSYQAMVDIEARADENELVIVGSSGRIMMIVSDNTRRTRTVLNVQVSNTGLAASRFKVKTRDCGPVWPTSAEETDKYSEVLILLAPKHTQSIRLNILNEIPADVAHCAVTLLNDEGETVAVRDVNIKKGDRCFCVWHCECVCLTDDPSLLCREMSEGRQAAAGLSSRERPRRARSVCYPDVVTVDLVVTAFGVLLALLFFGFIKACLGLIFRCVGSWGLHRIIQMPRKLNQYYENSLKNSEVVYDDEGWPVHPQTKKRTVRLISKHIEFLVNLTYFITAPCIIVYDIMKYIYSKSCKKENPDYVHHHHHHHSIETNHENKCFSSRDIQASNARRSRRRRLTRWMTTEAEDLSTHLWQTGLQVQNAKVKMQPHHRDEFGQERIGTPQAIDSDMDETEYVLMQMQKSRESLARNQRNEMTPEQASVSIE